MAAFNAHKLRQMMNSAKVSGIALAQAVGVSNVSISRILNSKQQPSKKLAIKLAQQFDMSVDDLYSLGPPARCSGFDGKALASIRKNRNITQPMLSKLTQIDLANIQNFESGRDNPSETQIETLAGALDITPRQLLWQAARDFRGDTLRSYRTALRISPNDLAVAIGIPADVLLRWEAGELCPSQGELARAEQMLGLRFGDMQLEDDIPGRSGDQREIIETIKRILPTLSTDQCRQILAYIQGISSILVEMPKALASRDKGMVASQITTGFTEICEHEIPDGVDWRPAYVPVIDNVAAGAAIETIQAEEFPPGWAESFVAYNDAPDGAFAVRVTGDSMAPKYNDGDMLVIDPNRESHSGELCVVIYSDQNTGVRHARCKRIRYQDHTVTLESLNPNYPTVTLGQGCIEHAYHILSHLPKLTAPHLADISSAGPDLTGIQAIADRERSLQTHKEYPKESQRA